MPDLAKWAAFEDTNFQAADSPAVIAPYTTDWHDAPLAEGYIACDGQGSLQVEVSQDGTDYGTAFTMKKGEVVALANSRPLRIRLTHLGTDSAYRIVVVPVPKKF